MFVAARNIAKSWLLVLALAALFGLIGCALGGARLASIFVFCALLLAAGAYWTFDRVVLGMLGAREIAVGEAPLPQSTAERASRPATASSCMRRPSGWPPTPRSSNRCSI